MKRYTAIVGLMLAAAFVAFGQGVKIVSGDGTERIVAASGKEYNSGMTKVPATLTALTATTTKVQVMWCSNATGTSATLTLTDTAGLPYGTAVPIAGNSIALIHNSLVGVPMVGIKWQAGTADAIYCQVVGVQ